MHKKKNPLPHLPSVAIGLALFGLTWSTTARATGAAGDELVAKMDHEMTKARTQFFEYKVVTEEPGKKPRLLRFGLYIMGSKKRRIEFLAPGDVKGMRFLVLAADQMYVYMPAYKKVRRVASHVKSQGFMGTAYSQDEMSVVTYGEIFSGRVLDEDEKEWAVELTRRPDQTFPYPKLKMRIRKDLHQPAEVQYFNDKLIKIKTQTRTSYECKAGLCNPRVITMIDHSRGDVKSVMVRTRWKPNIRVDERFFTVRSLQRRR